jgi:regulatory protein
LGSGTPESEERKRLLRKAREDAVAFIGISARTSGAVAASLRRFGHADDIVDEVVAGLSEDGYVKDREVARALLARNDGKAAEARDAMRDRMLRRGIPFEVAEETLADAGEDRATAVDLLHLKFADHEIEAVASRAEANRLAVRMARFLASRGFDPETAAEAVGKALERFDG